MNKYPTKVNEILLKLYFPSFKTPNKSRFIPLFNSLKFNEKINVSSYNKSLTILPERIISGEDRRSSIFIKFLPTDITKEKLEQIVSKFGNINFCFILEKKFYYKSYKYKCGIVNTVNYKTVTDIYMGLRKQKIFGVNSSNINEKKIPPVSICYSAIQNKTNLIRKFYNTNINISQDKENN